MRDIHKPLIIKHRGKVKRFPFPFGKKKTDGIWGWYWNSFTGNLHERRMGEKRNDFYEKVYTKEAYRKWIRKNLIAMSSDLTHDTRRETNHD